MSKRITADEAIKHSFFQQAVIIPPRKISVYVPEVEIPSERFERDLKFLFRTRILAVRFMWRIKNMRRMKLSIDRTELRKRPFRNRDIRHEAESAAFAVYGHWVNRGFHYSRDMLFAKARPIHSAYSRSDASKKPK